MAMALPLGKLTILVGAGLLGSVLAKEGRVSDLVSGAFKIAWKQIQQSDHAPSVKKPHNAALMAQMNSIRQELQIMASSRSVTIVTTSRTGTGRYGIIIVVIAAGCGYFWWKGWKLPDMMFATRSSLNEACGSVGTKLENIFSLVSVFKRKLSSQMDGVEHALDESIENNASTHQEVIEAQGRADTILKDFRKFKDTVLSLEPRINRFEGKQGETNDGVEWLCDFALNLENSRTVERIQASTSRPVLELPPASPSSLVTPLRSRPALELPLASPSRENHGILEAFEAPNRGEVSNGFRAAEDTNNGASSSGRVGFGFLQRARSATSGMLQQRRSTSQQL